MQAIFVSGGIIFPCDSEMKIDEALIILIWKKGTNLFTRGTKLKQRGITKLKIVTVNARTLRSFLQELTDFIMFIEINLFTKWA